MASLSVLLFVLHLDQIPHQGVGNRDIKSIQVIIVDSCSNPDNIKRYYQDMLFFFCLLFFMLTCYI
uniref:Predicted protein n=1 Tax=Hordeum vulgare subsp. vulgare TaxID=112509 RepID=F2EF51_HORVV|nr:predicted protein [Hordeum vulgare subsp. vulgare]